MRCICQNREHGVACKQGGENHSSNDIGCHPVDHIAAIAIDHCRVQPPIQQWCDNRANSESERSSPKDSALKRGDAIGQAYSAGAKK